MGDAGVSCVCLSLARAYGWASVCESSGRVCYNCLHMAGTEMEHIRGLDDDHVRAHLPKLSLYYGRTDGWVPLAHYERMRTVFPDADVHLCDPAIPHAFVLGHSEAMARLVAASVRRHLGLDPGPDPDRPATAPAVLLSQ
jgi:hypothetical protein